MLGENCDGALCLGRCILLVTIVYPDIRIYSKQSIIDVWRFEKLRTAVNENNRQNEYKSNAGT
jgi:hypothetical protein